MKFLSVFADEGPTEGLSYEGCSRGLIGFKDCAWGRKSSE
jgi:hypothetical protein